MRSVSKLAGSFQATVPFQLQRAIRLPANGPAIPSLAEVTTAQRFRPLSPCQRFVFPLSNPSWNTRPPFPFAASDAFRWSAS